MKFIPSSLWPKKGGSSQPMSSHFYFFFIFPFPLTHKTQVAALSLFIFISKLPVNFSAEKAVYVKQSRMRAPTLSGLGQQVHTSDGRTHTPPGWGCHVDSCSNLHCKPPRYTQAPENTQASMNTHRRTCTQTFHMAVV